MSQIDRRLQPLIAASTVQDNQDGKSEAGFFSIELIVARANHDCLQR